jgi:ubiquinone/menaquinone biosynthesis C-methylase UbiE
VFDVVYSYGVLHHTPNTQKAINEIYRVLKLGKYRSLGFFDYNSNKIRQEIYYFFDRITNKDKNNEKNGIET